LKSRISLILLVVLVSTFAMAASHKTYEYPEHGFSMVLPIRNSVEKTVDGNEADYTYSESPEDGDGIVWQMDMIKVTEGVDYAQVKDVHKLLEDAWARMVAAKNIDPIGPLNYSKDADGNEVATFEATLHTVTDGKKIGTHFTMRYVAVVKTSRFYVISVLQNFDEKVNDDFINSFKLLK
jgi:hypothetical protein